jgi:hypothetical protein
MKMKKKMERMEEVEADMRRELQQMKVSVT